VVDARPVATVLREVAGVARQRAGGQRGGEGFEERGRRHVGFFTRRRVHGNAGSVGAPRLARLFIVAASASACSKGAACGATDGDGGLPPGVPAMMAAPSPFSVEGARAPEDTQRFAAKLAALAWETLVHEEPRTSSKVLGYIRAGGIVAAA